MNPTRFRTLLFFCLIFTLVGQQPINVTNVAPGQLRGTTSAAGLVYVVTPSGGVSFAEVGSGIVLDTSGARPVLRAVLPPMPTEYFGVQATFVSGTSFSIPNPYNPATLRVHLNGLRVMLNADYVLNGQTLTFVPATGWTNMTKELVQLDYTAP